MDFHFLKTTLEFLETKIDNYLKGDDNNQGNNNRINC